MIASSDKGLAVCNSQTASPLSSLNNFYSKTLSNFLESLHFLFAISFTPVTIYLPLDLWQPAIGMGHLVA